jgi:hypothetical protein
MTDSHAIMDRAAKLERLARLSTEGEPLDWDAHLDEGRRAERKRILAIIRAEPFLVPEPEALHPGEKIAVADYRRRLLEKIGNA